MRILSDDLLVSVTRHLSELIFNPLLPVLVLVAVGLITHWRRRSRIAPSVLIAAWLLLLVCSLPIASRMLALKWQLAGHWEIPALCDIDDVVVLGSSVSADAAAPSNIRLSGSGLARLLEGVRIQRACSDSLLIISGCGRNGPSRCYASVAARMAVDQLGVSRESMFVMSKAENTEQEARLIGAQVRGRRFALVSSASHLRARAHDVRRRRGPADGVVGRRGEPSREILNSGSSFPRQAP